MRTAAVLPVKAFAAAKTRTALAPQGRAALAEAMALDVLDALARVRLLDAIVVVTVEPVIADAARAAGMRVVADPPEPGHSAAALHGTRAAAAERVLLVPGDCPALDPADVDVLLAAAVDPGVVVVPDRHGSGTNALLLAPPDAIVPAFGPGSCERHVALARAAGTAVRIAHVPSLAHDVDTPEDLADLTGAGPRTSALMAVAA